MTFVRQANLIAALLAAFLVVVWPVAQSRAAKRVALVIGNSAYEHTRVLPNPKNDATAIAETLKRLGFDRVTLKLDQNYGSMRETIRAFGREARDADVAFVYYAGHGLEVGRVNYLVPVDARLRTDDDLHYEAVTLDDVMIAVRKARRLRLVILDACRNNPIASSMELASGITRSVSRGFSRIEPEGDVLVAYAAKHGTVAEDGDSRHSPYAAALLKHLPTPGLDVGYLFRRVRTAVLSATSRRQEPFTYGSLGSESVYLVPPAGDTAAKAAPAPTPAGLSAAAEAWSVLKDTKTASDLEAFIKRFPDSFFADLARTRMKQLREEKVAARTTESPTRHPFDGHWKVTIDSKSGCSNNNSSGFLMNVEQGQIDLSQHKFRKQGHISEGGEFSIKVLRRDGGIMAMQTGTIDGDTGKGRMQGQKPSCKGNVTIVRIN